LHLNPPQTDHLVAHPLVPFVSFTGSVQNGKRVEKTAALAAADAQGPAVFKSVGLELGGKDAAYVREGECRVVLSSFFVRGERGGLSRNNSAGIRLTC
jgi:acyl-CoA reductase-like NAD-dependent aldehyde dehydrogenase